MNLLAEGMENRPRVERRPERFTHRSHGHGGPGSLTAAGFVQGPMPAYARPSVPRYGSGMPTDIEIARTADPRPIAEIAANLGLSVEQWRP